MRLLLVEDSDRLQRSVSSAFRRVGYAVDVASDGEEGLWMATNGDYDAIILDIMLPKLDGLTVLARLRAAKSQTHVLLLTARDTVADRVTGLRAGADDYLIKPFALDELFARTEALCRRAYDRKSPQLIVGSLVLDRSLRTARRGEQSITLTPREFALLEYLALRPREVITRSEIEAHIYDAHVDPMSNVVDSAVCTLRRKLGSPQLIVTRRGHGYVLTDSDQSAPST